MVRDKFEHELEELSRGLTNMGSLCEEAILATVSDLSEGDESALEHVSPTTHEIAEKGRAIEALCLRLLIQQQPVARDFRQISAALKLITDMKRIGVQCANAAEIIGFLRGRTGAECEAIGEEGRETVKMVTNSVEAFVKQDGEMARDVITHDDVVDALFMDVRKKLIDVITANPDDGEYALDLLMVAKYFERISDHAVNIAKRVLVLLQAENPAE